MNFNIKISEGIKFSKESGDFNKIHLNDLEGYNSLFGEKICHGCLVAIKFLKKINYSKLKNFKQIQFSFIKHFLYNKKIVIKKKRNYYLLYQNNEIKAEIAFINKIDSTKYNYSNFSFKKKIKYKSNKKNDIFNLLGYLSMYVGTIYPGKDSIIRKINLNLKESLKKKNEVIEFYSKKYNSNFPLVFNRLNFNNCFINFETIFRPTLKIDRTIPSKKIRTKILELKKNIIVIGSSSGIGKEFVNLLSKNNKIKIYASYFKNSLNNKKGNIEYFFLNVTRPNKKLFKLLKKIKNGYLYYFATPKIWSSVDSNHYYKIFNKYYLDFPKKILPALKRNNISFFFPSSTMIETSKYNSSYAKSKLEAEKKLLKEFRNKNVKINFIRFPEINTKQNLKPFIRYKYPSFTKLLNTNYDFQKNIFFD